MTGVGAFIGGKWEPNAVVTVEKGAHVPFHPTLDDVSDQTKAAFSVVLELVLELVVGGEEETEEEEEEVQEVQEVAALVLVVVAA